MSAIPAVTCNNETSPRGAGNTAEGSDPQIAYTIGGLRVSVPTQYTSRVARGAASELIASAHLMSLGYHVFRALASSCPCDLLIYRSNEPPQRVEVKSVAVSSEDRWNVAFARPANDEWDLLALVYEGHVVVLEKAPFEEIKESLFAALAPLGVVRKTNRPGTHCKRGHEFTPENTSRTTYGYRACKTCAETRRLTRGLAS